MEMHGGRVLTPLAADPGATPVRPARSTLLVYSFGSAAFGIKEAGLSAFLLIYYNQVLGLDASLVGAVMMIALFLDALIDPLIGYTSDHLRSRLGRRHLMMYAAIGPAAVCYMLLWNPPLVSQGALLGYLGLMVLCVRAFTSAYEIPNAALVAELTQGYDRRTTLQSMRFLFGWSAGMMMTIMAFFLLLQPTQQFPVGQLNPAGYRHYGWWAGAVMLVAGAASALGTRHLIPALRRLQARGSDRHSPRQIARRILNLFRQPSVSALLFSAGATSTASGIVFSLNTYFNTYFWHLDAEQIALVQIGPIVGVLTAIAVAPMLSRRWDKKDIAAASLMASVIITPLPFILKLTGIIRDPSVMLTLLIVVGSAAVVVGLNVLAAIEMSSMTADLVEDDEIRTGERIEGIIFSSNAFVQKCASGLGIFTASLLLSVTAFPDSSSPATVREGPLQSLTILYCMAVTALNITAVAVLRSYRIGRERHALNLKLLRRSDDATYRL